MRAVLYGGLTTVHRTIERHIEFEIVRKKILVLCEHIPL